MKAILFDDAIDATGTDGETGLTEFLSDDIDCSVRVEEAVTDYLPFDLFGPDPFGLGTAFLVKKGSGPVHLEVFINLIISLPREAVLLCGLRGPQILALPLDEHEQPGRDFVVSRHNEFPGGADDAVFLKLIQHA